MKIKVKYVIHSFYEDDRDNISKGQEAYYSGADLEDCISQILEDEMEFHDESAMNLKAVSPFVVQEISYHSFFVVDGDNDSAGFEDVTKKARQLYQELADQFV